MKSYKKIFKEADTSKLSFSKDLDEQNINPYNVMDEIVDKFNKFLKLKKSIYRITYQASGTIFIHIRMELYFDPFTSYDNIFINDNNYKDIGPNSKFMIALVNLITDTFQDYNIVLDKNNFDWLGYILEIK